MKSPMPVGNPQENAISFVTRKVLVSFHHPIFVPFGGITVSTFCAVCEYQDSMSDSSSRADRIPNHLTIVGLGDGRRLEKSLSITLSGYSSAITGMIDLSPGDLA